MALVQSDISAITLSACVMVGRVSFPWLKCTVFFEYFVVVGFYVTPMCMVVFRRCR